MKKYFLITFGFLLTGLFTNGQRMPVDEISTAEILSPIGSAFNRIFNGSSLDSVYIRLATLKKQGKGVFRIVHIGDSHVQAGHLPDHVRTQLQQFFGNAGRGLVFPYDVIQTTSPPGIKSSSNAGWKMDKVVTSGAALAAGISGYGIRSQTTGATLEISLPSEQFDRLRFFIGDPANNSWLLRTGNDSPSYMIKPGEQRTFYTDVMLESASGSFIISTLPSDRTSEFFGVSLENGNPGIIYHAIGVNGARYDQYMNAPEFWKQLPGLEADLYIISLGTNEAQRNKFEPGEFRKTISQFLQQLSNASPNVPVILTTAADSYKKGRPNKELRDLNLALFEYCTQKNIPVWDLYRVTNGYGSALNWFRRGYMTGDRVHFTAEGYRLQGQLFFNALAKSYNDYHGF